MLVLFAIDNSRVMVHLDVDTYTFVAKYFVLHAPYIVFVKVNGSVNITLGTLKNKDQVSVSSVLFEQNSIALY